MLKKFKPLFCALLAAGALNFCAAPGSAASIGEVSENIDSGEIICVDGMDADAGAFTGVGVSGEPDSDGAGLFPAEGTVINLEKIGLNVRLKPWGTILGVLPNSARVTVTGVDGEWYRIEYRGQAAYAYKTYIAIGGTAGARPGGAVQTADGRRESGTVKKDGGNNRISDTNDEAADTQIGGKIRPDNESGPATAAKPGTTARPSTTAKPETAAKPGDEPPEAGTENEGADPGAAGEAGTNPNENMTQASGERKGGKAFMDATGSMSRAAREEAIKKEILAGNTPSFLKNFKEIKVTKKLSDGKEHTVSYFAAPDYLAVGSDSDYVRTPMSPVTAQQIADKLGCMLPTAKMVDDIYAQAETKLSPQPMSSGNYPNWQNRMMKSEFYNEHQKLVQSQAAKSGHRDGQLVAGHKKDVIVSNSLEAHPDRVIIYGWQLKGGKNIQPLSWIHENSYADYSHGVRLIKREMIVDGKRMDAADVLKDPVLSQLLSKEGPVKNIKASR